MTFLEVLVEGAADVPTVRAILGRKFGLDEGKDYRIHPHRGKGELPSNWTAQPDRKHQGLLHQLPAKLRGYGRSLGPGYGVVVLVDADDEDCVTLKSQLVTLYNTLETKPAYVLFRIAIEETESWFLADKDALRAGYPSFRLNRILEMPPDSVVGAWERLAEVLGRKPSDCSGSDKRNWAEAIAPHLDLDEPRSPSLRAFIEGVRQLRDRIAIETG